MRTIAPVILGLLLVFPTSGSAAVYENPGQALTMNPSARSGAMGGAFVAVADDIDTLFHNPAGLGTFPNIEVSGGEYNYVSGIKQEYACLAYNLHDFRASNVADLGALAVGGKRLYWGENTHLLTAADAGARQYRDEVVTVGYGKPVFDRDDIGMIYFGAGVKFLSEESAGTRYSNTAFDTGLLWRTPYYGLSLGVLGQNLGKKLAYGNSGASLPRDTVFGVAYAPRTARLLLAADAHVPENSSSGLTVGGEYLLTSALVLRGGYDFRGDDKASWSGGAGVRLTDLDIFFFYVREADISYAYAPRGDLGDTHRLALTLKLGAE